MVRYNNKPNDDVDSNIEAMMTVVCRPITPAFCAVEMGTVSCVRFAVRFGFENWDSTTTFESDYLRAFRQTDDNETPSVGRHLADLSYIYRRTIELSRKSSNKRGIVKRFVTRGSGRTIADVC